MTFGAVDCATTVAVGKAVWAVADDAAAVVSGADVAVVVIPPPTAAEGARGTPSGVRALGAIGSRRKVETSIERSAHNLLDHHFWCGVLYKKKGSREWRTARGVAGIEERRTRENRKVARLLPNLRSNYGE